MSDIWRDMGDVYVKSGMQKRCPNESTSGKPELWDSLPCPGQKGRKAGVCPLINDRRPDCRSVSGGERQKGYLWKK